MITAIACLLVLLSGAAYAWVLRRDRRRVRDEWRRARDSERW